MKPWEEYTDDEKTVFKYVEDKRKFLYSSSNICQLSQDLFGGVYPVYTKEVVQQATKEVDEYKRAYVRHNPCKSVPTSSWTHEYSTHHMTASEVKEKYSDFIKATRYSDFITENFREGLIPKELKK